MIDNEKNSFARINAFHLDNIGKLYVLVDFYNIKNIADKFKSDKLKIFNKCEDGNLDIKMKLNSFNLNNELSIEAEKNSIYIMNITIFLSESLSPKLNATKFILNYSCVDDSGAYFERLTIVYSVNANIFNKNNIFEKTSKSLRITDCFDKLNSFNFNDNNLNRNSDITQEAFYLKSIKTINCKNCRNILYDFSKFNNDNLNNVKIKIIENFDYDYIDKLENLSCHESHTEDIIPNIEEKLKMR